MWYLAKCFSSFPRSLCSYVRSLLLNANLVCSDVRDWFVDRLFRQATRNTGKSIAGRNIANPTAMLLASCLMLDHLKWVQHVGHADHVCHIFSRHLKWRAIMWHKVQSETLVIPLFTCNHCIQTFYDLNRSTVWLLLYWFVYFHED